MSRKQGEDSLCDEVLNHYLKMYTYKCYIFLYYPLLNKNFYIVFFVWFSSFILNLDMKKTHLGKQTISDIPFR